MDHSSDAKSGIRSNDDSETASEASIPRDANHSPMLGGGSAFFADVTLDLSMAHSIAETPEPKKHVVDAVAAVSHSMIEIPSLQTSEGKVPTDDGLDLKYARSPASGGRSENLRRDLSLNRITHADNDDERIPSNQPTYRPKMPRRPRDIAWAMAFLLVVPLSLSSALYPSPDYDHQPQSSWFLAATSKPTRTAIAFSLFIAFVATQVIARILYRTMGGGDGDDARHVASQIILFFAPFSVAIHPLIMLTIYLRAPRAIWYALLPLALFVQDVWALRHWRRGLQSSSSRDAGRHDQGRQTFFRALTCMALDILSRSLRRSSFYRIICSLLAVQMVVVWLWHYVLLRALAIPSGPKALFWLSLAIVGGKWATGTIARILGLVASGGITSWFAQQSIMMEEMEAMKDSQAGSASNDNGGTSYDDVDGNQRFSSMPEAYRSADASAYMSVLDLDEGIDDDFEEDEEEGTFVGSASRMGSVAGPRRSQDRWGAGGSTVKAFLFSAVTVSFGSVAQCGLVGGFAQFVWSVIRNMDSTATMISRRVAASGRFQGMQIGAGGEGTSFAWKLVNDINDMARSFVRSHSELALSHVAAYFKNYQRASKDVFVLVDSSGVEPIIHDDISTHMCSNVCVSVSGVIVVLVGFVVSHHGQISDSAKLRDRAIVESMIVSFFLSYTLLFTVMEPLRASIKAIYVCFAQHPQSLSQAFPLIFHRLSRISEATLV